MLAGQQEVGRRLPTAEGRQRRAAREAFSARRGRERGVKGAKKGQGGGQTGPGRRLGTWLKAACALARQGAGSLGVSAAGRARAGGGERVCSSCPTLPEFRMFTNSQYPVPRLYRCKGRKLLNFKRPNEENSVVKVLKFSQPLRRSDQTKPWWGLPEKLPRDQESTENTQEARLVGAASGHS